ncbi:hypothetical protein [Photobacterium damselae]|uniref:hypothetical protein n=1 Tax=Photobacterium damselae TaxID=38293 RepID=UPI001F3AC540|nr:hypothetical protein [Photobacterium damselae]UKA03964.1 hypothetical protein IHC89_15660 [Photobacterium damselae subsp. damselae]
MKLIILVPFLLFSYGAFSSELMPLKNTGYKRIGTYQSALLWEEVIASAYKRYISWNSVCDEATIELSLDNFRSKYLEYRLLTEVKNFIRIKNKSSELNSAYVRLSGISAAIYSSRIGLSNRQDISWTRDNSWVSFYQVNKGYCKIDRKKYKAIKNINYL